MDMYSTYKGKYKAQQQSNAWEVFEKFLLEEPFDLIVEIGTAVGGFIEFLHDFKAEHNLNYELMSFDIEDPHNTHSELIDKGINVNHIDIFEYDLQNLIQSHGRVLLLCDGGDKPKEFNTFSALLKVGDVIMAHDYAPNFTIFGQEFLNKKWDWLEIQDEDIEECSIKNSLVPYNFETFADVSWVCKIKES
jgi:hypothetical protein